jgi:DNA repair protein RadC
MYRIPVQRISLVRDGSLTSERNKFANAKDVFEFCKVLHAGADREMFHVLLLDGKNKLIGVNLVSQGSLSESVVHPREVFKAAILSNCSAIIGIHNHPSGDPLPSEEDKRCTTRLAAAGKVLGIPLLDHVVCGESEYFSFADAGLMA